MAASMATASASITVPTLLASREVLLGLCSMAASQPSRAGNDTSAFMWPM